jgi:S1-C subfamily serine protease
VPLPQGPDIDPKRLERSFAAVVAIKTFVPSDAMTAEILGTERAGYGVIIRADGIVLTIGYLVTEAETVWVTLSDGRALPGHVLGYDQATGLGLVRVLARVELPFVTLGSSTDASVGDPVVVAGAGGMAQSVAATIIAKQEFAGYWEYVLEDAIFTSPAHPNWGGTAVFDAAGALLGIGSLQIQQAPGAATSGDTNMIVPIDAFKPIMDDLLKLGRPRGPARPWLGLYATAMGSQIAIMGVASKGPAKAAGFKSGDIVKSVAGHAPQGLADFFRHVWAAGPAGVAIPFTLNRENRLIEVNVHSVDRNAMLKGPIVH